MAIRIFLLLRLVAFIAVFYLALHMVVARRSRKPGSKLLWFFEVLTAPLTRFASRFAAPGTSPERLRGLALAGAIALWLAIVVAEKIVVGR